MRPLRSVAEAVGTFGFIFAGTAVVASKYFPDAQFGVLGIALAHALVLSVMITATMSISGGHMNPAVTLALLAVRRITLQTALVYIVAQLIGAVLAGLALKTIYPPGVPCRRAPAPHHCQHHDDGQGHRARGRADVLPGVGGVRDVRQSRCTQSGRIWRGNGAAVRYPGGRPAHRLSGQSRACLRAGARLRGQGIWAGGPISVGDCGDLVGPRCCSETSTANWEHVLLPKRVR